MSVVFRKNTWRAVHKCAAAYAAGAAALVGGIASVYALEAQPTAAVAAESATSGTTELRSKLSAARGFHGYEIAKVSKSIQMAPGDSGKFVTAMCPSGKKVLGGGYSSSGFFTFPNNGPVSNDRWQVLVVNRHTAPFTANVTVYAICAFAS